MSILHLGNRFFILTAVGYVTAVVSCVLVVLTLSVPFLKSAQIENLNSVASQQASAAAFMLDEVFDRAEYLARAQSVRDLVTGQTENPELASDRINTFATSDLRHAKILDYKGGTLYETSKKSGHARQFQDVEYREGFSQIGQASPGSDRLGRIRLRRDLGTGHTHILIAVPVIVNGVMEGAIVLEKHLALESALPGGSMLLTAFQRKLELATSDVITSPVQGLPLFVRLGDELGVTTVGTTQTSTLVSRIALGLSVVLLVPFLTMSYFGAKHLVAPTHALARSRERLSEQQQQLKLQSEELRELAAVAELSRDAVTVTDSQGRIRWVNHSFTELTGYEQEEVEGKIPGSFLQSSATDPDTVKRIRQALAFDKPVREEILNVAKDGREYWVALSISPITDEAGRVQRFAAISSDVSERREIQEALQHAQEETEYRANHDTLTGLPNRRRLDHVLDTDVKQHDVPRTLIRVDLDFFKNVNDTHGHAAGDHVLKVVSDALRKHCRQGDLIARVGGDEFVVLLSPGATTEEANVLCERFRKEIREDIVFEGKTCRVGASFGVASALDGLVTNAELLVGADAALYVSKAQGRNTTTLYTPEVHTDVLNKRRSSIEIERAIEGQEFEPYFQPQIDAKTREIAGIEALVRWNHPEQGILAPIAFLPLAEQLSLVPEIDDIVYTKGLLAVQELNRQGLRIPKVSFNVGAKQLENPRLRSIHKDYDIGDTRVAFEVLESVLVEEQSSAFSYQIDILRDNGFLIEVDDFGSGHASVVGLMQLRPDAMKLDQRLIMPLTQDPGATVTVRALVEIGRAHGIEIIAEGVETEDHAQILSDLGVDVLQGYQFAKPLPLNEISVFLRNLHDSRTAA